MKKLFVLLLIINVLGLCACGNLGNTDVPSPSITNTLQTKNTSTPTLNPTETPNTNSPSVSPSVTKQPKKDYLAIVESDDYSVRLYEEPTPSSASNAYIISGAIVHVKYVTNGYGYIGINPPFASNDYTGYCNQKYLKPIEDIDEFYNQMNATHYTMTSDGYTIHAYRYKNYIDKAYLSEKAFYAFTDLYLYDKDNNFVDIIFSDSSSFMYDVCSPLYSGADSIFISFDFYDFNNDGIQELILYSLSERASFDAEFNEFNREVTELEIKTYQNQNNEKYLWGAKVYVYTDGVYESTLASFDVFDYSSPYVGKNPFLAENETIYNEMMQKLEHLLKLHKYI